MESAVRVVTGPRVAATFGCEKPMTARYRKNSHTDERSGSALIRTLNMKKGKRNKNVREVLLNGFGLRSCSHGYSRFLFGMRNAFHYFL